MADWNVITIGAGPAGLMAATRVAELGRRSLLVDKNRKPAVKILLSGGTRCNLTHAAERRGIVAAFGPAGRFLYSALAALGPEQLLELFAEEGVSTKVEPEGKVFPASDRAADVVAALVQRLRRSGAVLAPEEPVAEVQRAEKGFRLITVRRELTAEKVILATGGQSYPDSGSTGDGYRFAAALGHTIIPPRPALVPVTSHAPWVRQLQGITMPYVLLRVVQSGDATLEKRPHALAGGRGALLFTHFGVSGPAVLDVSRVISRHERPQSLWLECDLLPSMEGQRIETLLLDQSGAAGKRRLTTLVGQWVPQRLAEKLVELAGITPDCRAAELSKPQRRKLARTIKRLSIPVAGTMGFKKAEVTSGGVALDEVDSRAMQSKLVPGLYFAGEVLDLDGPIGGYNFQAAFSTGWLAGESAAGVGAA